MDFMQESLLITHAYPRSTISEESDRSIAALVVSQLALRAHSGSVIVSFGRNASDYCTRGVVSSLFKLATYWPGPLIRDMHQSVLLVPPMLY